LRRARRKKSRRKILRLSSSARRFFPTTLIMFSRALPKRLKRVALFAELAESH